MSEDWPYRFELLPPGELFVDKAYQRGLSTLLRGILRNWDPALLGTLIVSDRGEKKAKRWMTVDGQTRAEAMRRRKDPVAPCLVYSGLTQADEARLFERLQTQRRGMATPVRFRAALVAKNPEAMGIARTVRDAGFHVAGDGDLSTGIRSIAALEWIYRRDPALLTLTLATIAEAWHLNGDYDYNGSETRGEILRGLARFIHEHDPDPDRLVKRLEGVTANQLRTRANNLREGSGSSGNYELFVRDALLGVYNRRR